MNKKFSKINYSSTSASANFKLGQFYTHFTPVDPSPGMSNVRPAQRILQESHLIAKIAVLIL